MNTPKTMTFRLSIEVSYETNGVTTKELEGILTDAANHLAGEGLFTGESPAEVTSWRSTVEGIHASAPLEA